MAKTSSAMKRSSAMSAGGNPTVTERSNTRSLDNNLIRRANEASVTDIGDATKRQYQRNLDDIAEYTYLSDSERENALSKLYDLTTKQLEAEARTENPYATGRGVARFDRQLARARGDDAVYARVKVEEHMREVRGLNLSNQRKAHQQAIATAAKNALESKALEYTVNGVTYRRKSTRSKTFERVY